MLKGERSLHTNDDQKLMMDTIVSKTEKAKHKENCRQVRDTKKAISILLVSSLNSQLRHLERGRSISPQRDALRKGVPGVTRASRMLFGDGCHPQSR